MIKFKVFNINGARIIKNKIAKNPACLHNDTKPSAAVEYEPWDVDLNHKIMTLI